jgi:transcriptional regulator with XRE-family HTH domain
MWLDIIREKRKELGYSYKYVAEEAKSTERTVTRIFSGETKYPSVDTLYRIAVVLDLSLDDLLADSKSVVGGKNYVVLQEENELLTKEIERLSAELSLIGAENAVLKDKVVNLTAENDILRLKLEHKEEIISLHNYYINLKQNSRDG